MRRENLLGYALDLLLKKHTIFNLNSLPVKFLKILLKNTNSKINLASSTIFNFNFRKGENLKLNQNPKN